MGSIPIPSAKMAEEKLEEKFAPIVWQAPESEYSPKDVSWYWLSLILAAVLIIFALWQRNFLFAVFVVIAESLVISLAGRFPESWEFKINEKGLILKKSGGGAEKIYQFKDIKSFDIHLTDEGGDIGELILKFNSKLSPYFKINFFSKDEKELIAALSKFLPREEIKQSLADEIFKIIKF